METRDSFGYWVRRRRKALDLTQDALAHSVGCALVTLRKIEADERRPSPQMAERLALCLALPVAEWPEFVAAATGTHTQNWLDSAGTPAVRLAGNLPAPVTSLIGRDGDVAGVMSLLQRKQVRLLTLTGPVGVGKTRLAVEVGRHLRGVNRDGVHLVELATVSEPALVPPAIAAIFAVREGRSGELGQRLIEYLAPRELLLLLDNFEHLLPATAFMSLLLANCPGVRLLVTSRARLHLYGEHEYVVMPLRLPAVNDPEAAAAAPAVHLFCVRAQAARSDFQLTPSTTPTVAAICRQLDGLPLAIELAAARIKLFSPQELQQRLPHASPETVDLRSHLRVLEEAIAWSYSLLTSPQQTLLARLGIFAGGFSLPAAEAICAASATNHPAQPAPLPELAQSVIAEELAALLDQSLLMREGAAGNLDAGEAGAANSPRQRQGGQRNAVRRTESTRAITTRHPCPRCPVQSLREVTATESRFVLLETIRTFALEQLAVTGELTILRQRHAEYFVAWAELADGQLQGPAQIFWLACLDRNADNVRAALTWLADSHQSELAARLTCALSGFWQRHGHYSEGRRWLDRVLAALDQTSVPDRLRARTLQSAAALAYRQGDREIAQRWLAASLALYQVAADQPGMARIYYDLGWIAIDRAQWPEALSYNQESLALARAASDPVACYQALTHLGWTQLCMGNVAAASPNFDEAYTFAQQAGHIKGEAVCLANLGWIAFYRGDAAAAANLAQESLRLCCQLGERELMAECLELLAVTANHTGHTRRSVTLSGAASALREALRIFHPPTQHTTVTLVAAVAAARRQLADADYIAAWQEGRNLRIEAMVVYALGCGNALGF